KRESAGFVCLGGAASAFDAGLETGGDVVLGLGRGSGTSPKRSGCCALCIEEGPAIWGADGAAFCDAERSMLCFSFTRFNGISSSPSASSVEGSGIGPSITHLLDSYFVLMKFSILVSEGTCPGASFASQYLFARELPHFRTF